jgi:hypothetical protein
LHSKQSDQQLLIRPLGIDNLAVARKGRTQKFSSLGAGKYLPMPRYRYLILAIFYVFLMPEGRVKCAKSFLHPHSSCNHGRSAPTTSETFTAHHCLSIAQKRGKLLLLPKKKELEKQQDNMFMSLCVFRFTIINVENET